MFLSAIFCSLSKDFGIDLDDTYDNDDDKTIDPTPPYSRNPKPGV